MKMNWKLVTLGGAGLLTIAAGLINSAAQEYYHKVAREKALSGVSDEILKEVEEAKEVLDLADEVAERERKEIRDNIRSWKRQNNYDDRIRDAHQKAVEEMNDFKHSIDYFNRKQDIENSYEDALETFKESIDYDYEISLNEAKIEDAKALYKKRCKKIESASGSDSEISDALSDVKKGEKEKMEDTVKEAKDNIARLKGKVLTEENRLKRKKEEELRKLESELQVTKSRLNKAETDACSVINAEMSKAEEKFREEAVGKRTEVEISAIDHCDECIKVIDDQKNDEEKNAWSIYENASTSEKWGTYLKSEHVPRWVVVLVGALPLIPVGFAVDKYVRFVYGIVKAM